MKPNLICSSCGSPLDLPDEMVDSVLCSKCGTNFKCHDRAWDFRVLREDQSIDWDAEVFDAGYKKTLEGFEDGFKHARKQGIPDYIETYRQSRVKGTIAPWILENGPDSVILDLGCGHGWYAVKLCEHWNLSSYLFGVDISPHNVNMCIREAERRNFDKLGFFCANGEKIPFADASFDTVYSTEVLEHVAQPGQTLREVARVLKPGGEFIITTPAGPVCEFWEGLFWLPRKIKHLFKPSKCDPDTLPYDKPLSYKELKKYLEDAGFRISHYHKAVFLPHESFIQFFPAFAQRLLFWGALIQEKLGPLSSFMGLHHIIRAQK